jgi:putative Mg2+ transporter-C (MgtC) family protein
MISYETLLQLLLAVVVGGLIGAEREYHNKAAGFRTLIFICLGSTLFTSFSIAISRLAGTFDPARLAAQIVTGVGFIGAGAILRDAGRIIGLTTAATIWLVAALGIGIGIGEYGIVGAGTAVTIIVLALFPRLEAWIDALRDDAVYEITTTSPETIEALLAASRLKRLAIKRTRCGARITYYCHLRGKPALHTAFVQHLMDTAEIEEFRF